MFTEVKPVTISYKDFKSGKDFTKEITEAFGRTGLGLVVVKDLPDFSRERSAALRAIRKFADLPEKVKEKYTHPQSKYRFVTSS